MICPGCNTRGVVHAYGQTTNPPCASWPRCPRCADAFNPDAKYIASRTDDIRGELGICYCCAIREERARDYAAGKSKRTLVIDGYTYSADSGNSVPLGQPDPQPRATMRGMAGRRFDIERLDGTPPFSCYSLWAGGEVDQWSKDRMPDNARFLNGARRANASGTTCFNPSRDTDGSPQGTDAQRQDGGAATAGAAGSGIAQ